MYKWATFHVSLGYTICLKASTLRQESYICGFEHCIKQSRNLIFKIISQLESVIVSKNLMVMSNLIFKVNLERWLMNVWIYCYLLQTHFKTSWLHY